MRRIHPSFHLIFFILIFTTGLANLRLTPVKAQTPTPNPDPTLVPETTSGGSYVWEPPVNLSHSGAASEPRLLASQDGQLQAFWIDKFDGLMTALYNSERWSAPVQSMRPTSIFIAQPTKIEVMPSLYIDSMNRIDAFWYGEENLVTGEAPLYYSSLPFGSAAWTAGVQVAESAAVFNVLPLNAGELELAYIRNLKTETTYPRPASIPPGVYSRRTSSAAKIWNSAAQIESSIYYRVLPAEQAFMRLTSSGNVLFMMWMEPRMSRTLYAASTDGGISWSSPVPLGGPETQIKEPQITVLPGGDLLRIWQDGAQSNCTLFQQEMNITTLLPAGSTQTPAARFQPTPTPSVQMGEWSDPQQILPGLEECPNNSRFVTQNGVLYWLWGENSSTISFSAWNPDRGEWTYPQSFSFSFEDPEIGRPVQLDDLHVELTGDKISVIGVDKAFGEIWTTSSRLSALNIAYAPASPWSKPYSLSDLQQTASQPALAVDSKGIAHAIWSQGLDEPGTSLYHASFDGSTPPQSSQIVKGNGSEIVRQPNLQADAQDRLHLAWSGGSDGEIYYSRALADQAGSASGWLPAKQVSGSGLASWPQIAISLSGRIYILYAMPINEGRGIYLVSSDDGGDTWSLPTLVFDGQAAGWEIVDHPTLAIAEDGSLHAAWSWVNLASTDLTHGIYYSRTRGPYQPPSMPEGGTPTAEPAGLTPDPQWINALEVAPVGSDWPRLAIIENQLHLIYFAKGAPSHRWLDLSQSISEGAGWGTPTRLPGWEGAIEGLSKIGQTDAAPFALAADHSTLRVMGPIANNPSIMLSEWNAPPAGASGRWGQPEIFTPAGLWNDVLSVAGASPATGGALGVAWLAQPAIVDPNSTNSSLPQLYLTVKQVPVVKASPSLVNTPKPEVTQIPEYTPTLPPTATPQFDLQSDKPNMPVSPLVLGGGLAAVIVVAIFIGILVQSQNR